MLSVCTFTTVIMWKYYNKTFHLFLVLFFSLLLWIGCANVISPTGGPKDEIPPKVIWEKSDANMQTNFTGRSFKLTFDEWIILNDVFNQVVVTPPLEFKPEISLKKRTLLFEFDGKEVLRPDATYIINFGKSIKDNHEGKIAENLRFVFSTGDFIDSLSVAGKVVDAFSGDPVEGVIVMLYDNLADSVVRTERPFYLARTTKEGTFQIDNVKADTFKVFGLVDKNFNYLFDLPSEQIAYANEPFILSDSIKPSIQLQLFEERQALRLITKKTDRYGKVTLLFNEPTNEEIQLSFDSIIQQHHIVYEKDSIHFWYHLTDSTDWSLYIQKDTLLKDTVKVKALNRKKYLAKAKLKLEKGVLTKLSKQRTSKPIELTFNHPLLLADTNAILLLQDTLKTRLKPKLIIKPDDPRTLQLGQKWKVGMPYELILLPGAITDLDGLQNDSIPVPFTVVSPETFGNLIVHMKDLDEAMPYVIQLFNGTELIEETAFQADSIYTKEYPGMEPAIYSMRVIEDKNGNKRWDPGNYSLKTQSEKLYFRQLGELRADWDLELDFSVAIPEKN